jgi:glyoxalase superfamily protein
MSDRPGKYWGDDPGGWVRRNRVHPDVQAGGGRGEPQEVRWARVLEAVARLTGAVATVVREDIQDGVPDHFVMTDPEGNEFCVLWARQNVPPTRPRPR